MSVDELVTAHAVADIAAAAMSANAWAEFDSELGTLEWTTAPTTGGNFWGGDYVLTFNFTNEVLKDLDSDKYYVLAAYWGSAASDTYGANAVVLNYDNEDNIWTLQVGRGKLSSTTLDANTTFDFQENVVFDTTLVAGTQYTFSVVGGDQSMTPTLTWEEGRKSESKSAYKGNMNGHLASMKYGLLSLPAVDRVWGGSDFGNWSDESWTTSNGTDRPFASSSNVTFNSSVTMTATEDVVLGTITVAADKTLTLAGAGMVSSKSLVANGNVVISSDSTLAITEVAGDQNQIRDYSKVSGTGTLSLALNTVNGQGVDASSLTGTLFVSGEGRLQLNATTLGDGAAVKFANGADMVLNGTMTGFSRNITLEGTSQLYFNSSSSDTVTFSGNVSGGTLVLENNNTRTLNLSGEVALSGLSVSQNKTVNFTGSKATVETVTLNSTGTIGGKATVTNLNLAAVANFNGFSGDSNISFTNVNVMSGVTSISSKLDLSGSLWVGGATLNLDTGANITASQLRLGEMGASTMNIKSGATLTVVGNNNEHVTNASLLLSHWEHNSTLVLDGGNLVATDAVMRMSWSGIGTFKAQSGEARLKGLNFWGSTGTGAAALSGHFILGSESEGSAKVYLGSSGMQELTDNGDNISVVLGNGTLGATDNWSTSYNGGFSPLTIQLVGADKGTIFDTQNPDNSEGHTITINNSMTGSGKLVKNGAGVLKLSCDNSYTGGTTISQGTLVAASEKALGDGNVTVESGAKLSLGASAVTVMNLSGAGTINLADGRTSAKLIVNSTVDTTFSGMLTPEVNDGSRTLSLEKIGSGTLTLEGTGGLRDVSVAEGILAVDNPFALFESDVSVSKDASLKVVAASPVEGYATSVGTLTLADGATLKVDLTGVTPTADTFTLSIITATAIKFGDDMTLGGESVAAYSLRSEGTEVDLPDGYITFEKGVLSEYINNRTWSYANGTLYLTLAIPEPSLFGLLAGLGALTLVGTRRRRSKKD